MIILIYFTHVYVIINIFQKKMYLFIFVREDLNLKNGIQI